MPVAEACTRTIDVQVENWLEGRCRNVHSQYGEDGLLDAIFKRIGTTNRWCFEVGAYDGHTYSNVASLIEQGWHAVLIEQDAKAFEFCETNHAARSDVVCLNEYVFPWRFDALLESAGLPSEPDLGVIDIDEQDFWLWAGMWKIRPRVMVVEFGLGRPVDQVPPFVGYAKEPEPVIQAGQNMIHYLGIAKGYLAVAMTEANFLFVRNDCLTKQEQEQCRTME